MELLKLRSGGAVVDELDTSEDDGDGSRVVVASFWCFFGEAAAKCSELNRLSRMKLFQIISAQA